jgi:hypothetical protein
MLDPRLRRDFYHCTAAAVRCKVSNVSVAAIRAMLSSSTMFASRLHAAFAACCSRWQRSGYSIARLDAVKQEADALSSMAFTCA